MTPELTLFASGFFGSAVVELLALVKAYNRSSRLPVRYKKFGFWVVRILLAASGGVFALIYKPQSLILAVHIGAATPLLIATFTEALPEENK